MPTSALTKACRSWRTRHERAQRANHRCSELAHGCTTTVAEANDTRRRGASVSDEQPTKRWERPEERLADEAAPPDVPIGKKVLDAVDLVAGYIPEVNILNGCNLTVNEGEFVGIIGPNGAGKSTLLKAILGQCNVRSGSVHLGDRDITGHKAHELVALGVGYVPQNRNVFPSLTVRENLEMGCFL